jgi:UDP-N-acetylmuramoyl-L-alanyl-D-glutamate--2,6-diaminopimelate ligase
MWQKAKNLYHLVRAFGANIWFGFPWKGMIVIGITGTDGKTTTSSLIYHILNSAGEKTALVTSVSAVINEKSYDIGFHVTTPRIFALRSYIRKAKRLGVKYFVLETTSHALDQNRVFGIPFEVGVLTNITHEHLDYHKTYENYAKTKAKLFKMSKIAVTNKDDESFRLINSKFVRSASSGQNSKLITYGMGKDADVNPINFPFKSDLVGKFNKYNILAAVSACKALGVKDNQIREGVKSFVPPKGREDIVYDKDFKVMIDFAHTPNAFEQILSAVRPDVKEKIIHVFGSAGLRDGTKRPIMGKNSSKYADIIILTSEDPRTESVEQINKEIKSGINNKKSKVIEIADRKAAIENAIKMAKKGDFILITGKGHEKSMNCGHGEEPWDEYLAVRNVLEKVK